MPKIEASSPRSTSSKPSPSVLQLQSSLIDNQSFFADARLLSRLDLASKYGLSLRAARLHHQEAAEIVNVAIMLRDPEAPAPSHGKLYDRNLQAQLARIAPVSSSSSREVTSASIAAEFGLSSSYVRRYRSSYTRALRLLEDSTFCKNFLEESPKEAVPYQVQHHQEGSVAADGMIFIHYSANFSVIAHLFLMVN
jgi:hypothetical protein